MQSPLLYLMAGMFTFSAIAQDQTLSPLVVTATRVETSVADLPLRSSVLSSSDLLLGSLPRTLPEALRTTPSAMIQKTAHGQGSPYLRGWTGFRTLLLVDGIRMNNSVYRDGPNQYWNTVDSFALDRVEVVLGPGSVLYGSDAIGGTVQAITPNPLDRVAAGDQGRAYLRASSAEDSWTTRLEKNVSLNDKTAARAGVTRKFFGDLRSGDGRQPKTGYDEWAADAALSGLALDDARWTVAAQTLRIDDAWRTHRTPYAVPFKGSKTGTDQRLDLDQERSLVYARWEQASSASAWRDLSATLSVHNQAEDQYRVRADGRRDLQAFDVNTYGLQLQGSLGDDASLWTLGAETYYDDVDSSTLKASAGSSTFKPAIQGPVGDDASYLRSALYLQNKRELRPGTDIIAGLRAETLAADVGQYADPLTGEAASLEDDWQALLGSLRLQQHLGEGWQAYAGVSQGFRAPNLSDLTRLDTARSGELETPSPGLDSENFIQYDLGLRHQSASLSSELSAFYTDVRDLIVRTPTGRSVDGAQEVRQANASEGWVRGIEATSRWTFAENWELWGVLTWMEGENDAFPSSEAVSRREPMSRIMPLTAHAGLRRSLGSSGWLEVAVTHAETADKLSSGDKSDTQRIPPGGTPGYTVLHLRSGWNLNESTTLSVALENVSDENYRVHGSGLNEAGRNLIVALEHRF